MGTPRIDDLKLNAKGVKGQSPSKLPVFEARVPMGKYCYGKGRRKVIQQFTNRQGFWILAVFSAIAGGTLVLYILGYLHLDGD